MNDLSKAFFTLHDHDQKTLRESLLLKMTAQEINQLPYRYWKER